MLARTVHAFEGFLVQEDAEIMTPGDALHDRHEQLVVVVRQVAFFVNGGKLELVRCHLVMTRLDGNAQLVAFHFQILHKLLYARRNRPEIMVVELLVLRALVP